MFDAYAPGPSTIITENYIGSSVAAIVFVFYYFFAFVSSSLGYGLLIDVLISTKRGVVCNRFDVMHFLCANCLICALHFRYIRFLSSLFFSS